MGRSVVSRQRGSDGVMEPAYFSAWLLLDSRVVGCADVVHPHCYHPFLLEPLLFQWP